MKNKKFLISFDVEYIPDELDATIEEALEHMFDKPCPHTRDFSHELGHA